MISGGQTTGSTGAPAAQFDKTPYLDKAKATCAGDPEQQRCETVKMPGYFQEACDSITDLANQKSCYEELTTTIETLGKDQTITWSAGKYADVAKKRDELKTKYKAVTSPPASQPPPTVPATPSTEGFYGSVGITTGTGRPQVVSPVDGTATGQATFTCDPDWPCDPKGKNSGGIPTAKSVTHFYGPRFHLEVGYKFKNHFIVGSTLSLLRGQNDDPTNFGNPGWLQALGAHIGYGFAKEGFVGRVTSGIEYGSFTFIEFIPSLSGPVDRGSAIGGNSDIGMLNINLLKFSIGHKVIQDGHLRLTGGLRTSLDDFLGANRHKINTAVYEGFGMSSDFYLGVEWAFGAQ